ncbi:hypothetical protein [Anaerorhabdus sp.]
MENKVIDEALNALVKYAGFEIGQMNSVNQLIQSIKAEVEKLEDNNAE